MYRSVEFSVASIKQIEEDLLEASQYFINVKRIFLVNGDAFVLSAKRLKEIADLIYKYLPEVEEITMYASINNIKSKTDNELAELKKIGIDDLWIGVETAHEETLKYMNKGFTVADTYEQLERLNKAGINHIDIFIFGAAGSGKGIENAHANAKLINTVKPKGLSITTLGAFGNSQLAKDVEAGKFNPAFELEVIEEQKKFIELVEVETSYLGLHAINTIKFDAELPKQREEALERINTKMQQLDESYLKSVPVRHSI